MHACLYNKINYTFPLLVHESVLIGAIFGITPFQNQQSATLAEMMMNCDNTIHKEQWGAFFFLHSPAAFSLLNERHRKVFAK